MRTLAFTITINASPEKVWKSIWEIENYKIWTRPFGEGSYYETDSFSEGGKIHFLMPGGDGMYSILEELDEPNYAALRHVGEIKKFEEQPFKDQGWTSAMETYELESIEGGTKLIVHVDTIEKYADSMNQTFPLALEALKNLAER